MSVQRTMFDRRPAQEVPLRPSGKEPVPVCHTYIGEYQIGRKLGQGGTATVYEALHERIGKRVALKVLLGKFAEDDEVKRRFFNDARAIILIGHPGLVEVFDFHQTPEGQSIIVMEHLEGESLYAYLKRHKKLSVLKALRIVQQMASILAAAHQKGIVHRDVKPANTFLVRDPGRGGGERVKMLDFGIAKLSAAEWERDETMTRYGVIMGTARYMAPEQCRGSSEVTDKADVYSLGMILYQMLAGAPAFSGGATEVMRQQIHSAPRNIREHDIAIPEDVADLLHRMLAKDPTARPSMDAVEAECLLLRANAQGVDVSAVTGTSLTAMPAPVLSRTPDAKGPAAEGPRGRWPLLMSVALNFVFGGMATYTLYGQAASDPHVLTPGRSRSSEGEAVTLARRVTAEPLPLAYAAALKRHSTAGIPPLRLGAEDRPLRQAAPGAGPATMAPSKGPVQALSAPRPQPSSAYGPEISNDQVKDLEKRWVSPFP